MNGEQKISVGSYISMGLAVILIGATWNLAQKFDDTRQEFSRTLDAKLGALEARYLTKEVFETEMKALRREDDLRQQEIMRRLSDVERQRDLAPK